MRLELTLCKESIYKQFTIGARDINAKIRIKNNTLVVSNELINSWEKFITDKEMKKYFDEWFFGEAILSKGYIKKVKLLNTEEIKTEIDVIIGTCELSEDKIIVGEPNMISDSKKSMIKFISNSVLNIEKKQRIKIKDIEDIILRNKYDNIFSVYETPIVLDVAKNLDSNILARYLANFYKNTKRLVIRDNFLDNKENLRNFRKYILAYIDKNNCQMILQFYWDDGNRKRQLERIFTNIDGYNSNIQKLTDKVQAHKCYIESDDYIFNFGYRLKLFGDNDDELTEEDNITITRKD